MLLKIKIRIEKELDNYAGSVDKLYGLNRISPLLSSNIKEFIKRKGKRIRPVLFCAGYLAFSKKTPSGLWRAALALELLHDFLLIHDDIIDRSLLRRNKPSMHALLGQQLIKNKKIKFNGQDLAIVAGDVMYAMAMDAFLAVKENSIYKEKSLKKLISSALYTGCGEFTELLLSAKEIEKVTQADIYKIYDYKTANYTFASPLVMGATLAAASPSQIKKLNSYGMLLGRAFQIKDDIIGTFGNKKETGKSNITDIKEAKQTLLLWHAFRKAGKKDKLAIKKIFSQKNLSYKEFLKIRQIIVATGSLAYVKKQISHLYKKAQKEINGIKMKKEYKLALNKFCSQILLDK